MLAHVTGWGLGELMALSIGELWLWCDDAVKLWNRLQTPDAQ